MPELSGRTEIGPLLVLAPTGQDGNQTVELLRREAIPFRLLPDGRALGAAIDDSIGAVLVADESLAVSDLPDLRRRLEAQPDWSDLPFVVLTHGGSGACRAPDERHLPEALGNVMFLERPLHALTLVSAVRTALRARRRQRQVQDHLAERAAKMEAAGRLTGGIAHDFNNLLTAMVGSLELLQVRVANDPRAAHHADVAVRAVERGATLTAQLLAFSRQQRLGLPPGAEPPALASPLPAEADDHSEPEPPGPRVPVLVIDDDPAVREVLVKGLECDGFDVVEAADGRAGVTLIERGAPAALAVIDFAMPGMNGAEVARAIQHLRPGLPVVLASGQAVTAVLDGITGAVTLHKPFKIAELTRTIHHLLDRASPTSRALPN